MFLCRQALKTTEDAENEIELLQKVISHLVKKAKVGCLMLFSELLSCIGKAYQSCLVIG